MKVLMINSVCGIRSTGRICTDIAQLLEERGHECKIAYGRESVPTKYQKYAIKIGGKVSLYVHALKTRLFDRTGFGSKIATKKLIRKIKEFNPDVIHLHNLHGYYLNISVLFKYLRKEFKGKILWSFYDCWSFTGHCAHFDFNGCNKWQTGCEKCKFKGEYPKSVLSRARKNYEKKKKLFSSVDGLSIVVPSKWMKDMVGKSYIKDYPIKVLPNGIDGRLFFEKESNFRKNNGLENKFIVLGVSSFWNKMKGLDFFERLASDLDEEKFKVVLVGEGENVSGKILNVPATNSIEELCELYSASDLFVNPTLQETQGLTTVEAFACGTPAVVFNSGGAGECVDKKSGIVVEKENYEKLKDAILAVQSGVVSFDSKDCKMVAKKYDCKILYEDFIKLYEEIIEG